MPLALRREIGHKLFLLEEDLAGSVKKLKGSRNEYRLRVGDWRALFEPRRPDGDGRCCRQSKGYLPMNPALPKSQPAAVDIDKQIRRGKAVLRELETTLEDLEDRRELAAARKRNAGRPGTSLRQAAKELGLQSRWSVHAPPHWLQAVPPLTTKLSPSGTSARNA